MGLFTTHLPHLTLDPYPHKTHTPLTGMGFVQVRIQVALEIPQGYLWHSLDQSGTRTCHVQRWPAPASL